MIAVCLDEIRLPLLVASWTSEIANADCAETDMVIIIANNAAMVTKDFLSVKSCGFVLSSTIRIKQLSHVYIFVSIIHKFTHEPMLHISYFYSCISHTHIIIKNKKRIKILENLTYFHFSLRIHYQPVIYLVSIISFLKTNVYFHTISFVKG